MWTSSRLQLTVAFFIAWSAIMSLHKDAKLSLCFWSFLIILSSNISMQDKKILCQSTVLSVSFSAHFVRLLSGIFIAAVETIISEGSTVTRCKLGTSHVQLRCVSLQPTCAVFPTFIELWKALLLSSNMSEPALQLCTAQFLEWKHKTKWYFSVQTDSNFF